MEVFSRVWVFKEFLRIWASRLHSWKSWSLRPNSKWGFDKQFKLIWREQEAKRNWRVGREKEEEVRGGMKKRSSQAFFWGDCESECRNDVCIFLDNLKASL